MKSGVFTKIVYQNETVIGKEVTQEGLIIGPPMRTENLKKLCIIGDPGLNLLVNVAAGGVGYDVSQILKPLVDDQIVNTLDVEFFVEDPDGGNQLSLASAESNFKLPLAVSSADDYNIATASKYLTTIGIDQLLAKKFLPVGDINVTAVSGNIYTLADEGTDSDIEDNIEDIEKGDILVVQGAEAALSTEPVSGSVGAWGIVLASGKGAEFVATGGWAEYNIGGESYLFFYASVVTDTLTGCVFYHDEDKTPVDTGTINQIATAYVTAIDKSAYEITVVCEEDLDNVDFAPSGGVLGTWQLYHDYSGIIKGTPTIYPKRSPKIRMSILANRASVQGKKTITTMGDLIDLFGADSVVNPLSHLAFDAACFFIASQSQFSIYAMDVDTTTPVYGAANAVSTSEVSVAINAISKYKAYHIVPSYRFDDVTDRAAVLAILALYKAAIIARSAVEARNEGHLWCCIPLINLGYGYVDAADASDAVYGGADLSAIDEGTNFVDCPDCDADDDYDAMRGLPGDTFDSELVTMLPAYAFMGTALLPGSAVPALVAGFRAQLDPGYSTTNETPSAITSVPSVEYFNGDQIENMKSSGWQIIWQENSNAVPTIYHQTTTDPDTLERREEDLVIATHLCASEIRATLKPFIAKGKVNRLSSDPTSPVTAGTLSKLNSAISGIKRKYIDDDKIFSDLQVLSVTQNVTNPDQSDIKISINYYYPHNRANVILYV